MRTAEYKLQEIAEIERAQADKCYPRNTVLIQLSACDGQIHLLRDGGGVDSRFCCIIPYNMDGRYLASSLEMTWPDHYAKTNQGINYPFSEVGNCPVRVHHDKEDRENCLALVEYLDQRIETEKKIVADLFDIKEFFLGTLFPN